MLNKNNLIMKIIGIDWKIIEIGRLELSKPK